MRTATLIAGFVLPAIFVGCDQSPYAFAPVRGTVTIDGKPLGGGRVMFAPIAQGNSPVAGKPAFGTLQWDGSYVLTTYQDGDGAIVGEHWITVFGPKSADKAAESSAGRPATRRPTFRRFVVRQKRSVDAGKTNQIDIQLTSHEIARFAVKDDG